jgi:hypothetical protein
MDYVFADSSGEITDPAQKRVVLATLIVEEKQEAEIGDRLNRLKHEASILGVNTSKTDFEFHTHDICQRESPWDTLNEKQRMEVLRRLSQNIIYTEEPRYIKIPKLHFALILIDKEAGGEQGLNEYCEDIERYKEKALELMPLEQRRSLEDLFCNQGKKKTEDKLSDMLSLLFGLTTGLMHHVGFKGNANVIVDRGLLRQAELWEPTFKLLSMGWEITKGLFPLWPKTKQPAWHLGDSYKVMDSCNSYGVQLADFVSYTTLRILNNPLDPVSRFAVTRREHFRNFFQYKGIYLAVSHKGHRKILHKLLKHNKRHPWQTMKYGKGRY